MIDRTSSPAIAPSFRGQSEMADRMRTLDWTATAAGPPETWPEALHTALGICLGSRFPIIIFWGPELVQLYNDAYRPILGERKHPAFLGQPAAACWREIWDTIGPMLHGVLTTGEATWSEDLPLPMIRNGFLEETYFTFSYSPIHVADGVGGVFCAVQETTEQVIGRRRLLTLRDLAVDAPDVPSSVEAMVRVLEENPRDVPFALVAGVAGDGPPRTLAATTVARNWRLPAPVLEAIVARAGTGEAADVELDPAMPAPTVAEWPDPARLVRVAPVGSSDTGSPLVLVTGVAPGIPLDAAHRRFQGLVAAQVQAAIAAARAYDEERRRAQALAELDAAKTAFFSNVSHEFRTPLTLLLGPLRELELRARDRLQADEAELLEIAQRNGRRLHRLVNALLDVARIEAGRVKPSLAMTDLGAHTSSTVSMFRSTFELAGLELRLQVPAKPVIAAVDPELWEQIVLNLVSNAFKFTLQGEVSVTLAADEAARTVELVVADTGVGVPAEELPHLLDRFHRVTSTGGRSQEGTGLGLSLVDELSRLHDGEVTLSSEVGRGTTARVTLPWRTLHDAPAQPWTPRIAPSFVEEALRWLPDASAAAPLLPDEPAGQLAGAGAPGEGPRPRILVADDNADLRDYLVRLLGTRYEVETVADGEQALERLRANPPALVLADVMMPRLDGLALARAVREDPAIGRTPILLLSARAGEEARIDGLEAGADDYLVKPFSARELLASVAARLEISRLREEGRRALERALEEQAALNLTLATSQVELLKANAAKDEFLGLVSHELRTPITTILGNAEVVRRAGSNLGSEVVESAVDDIAAEADRLNELIENLLLLARDAPAEPEPVLVNRIVERATAQFRSADPAREVRLVAAPAAVIDAPPVHVEQLLRNLLSNAAKYGGTGTVEVRVERAEGEVLVRVLDAGIGFPTPERRTSFSPFERAPEAARIASGMGVGLVVCERIVTRLGGRLWAQNRPTGGAEVGFALPEARLDAD